MSDQQNQQSASSTSKAVVPADGSGQMNVPTGAQEKAGAGGSAASAGMVPVGNQNPPTPPETVRPISEADVRAALGKRRKCMYCNEASCC